MILASSKQPPKRRLQAGLPAYSRPGRKNQRQGRGSFFGPLGGGVRGDLFPGVILIELELGRRPAATNLSCKRSTFGGVFRAAGSLGSRDECSDDVWFQTLL